MPTSPNSRARGDKSRENSMTPSSAVNTPQTNESKKDSHIAPSTTPAPNGSDGNVGQSKRSRRMQRQNLKQRFMKLREDAQLAGLIHTEPEGAVRDERSPAQPKLVERALREGWAVPEEIKPELVQELVAVVQDEEAADKTKVAAFRALLAADQAQHDRDNPQKTAKGGQINVSVQTNIAAVDVLRQALQKDGHISSTDTTTTPSITSSTSDS